MKQQESVKFGWREIGVNSSAILSPTAFRLRGYVFR